jgi:hypothetical protein
MVKSYDLRTAIIAFFVTVAIFAAGFVIASLFNDYKVELLQQEYSSLSKDMESLQLEEQYLETVAAGRQCSLVDYQLSRLSEALDTTSSRLVAYQNSREFGSKFQDLKEQYSLVQVRAWLQAVKAKKDCGLDIATVVYFFDIACNGCEQQGYTLDYYKQQLGSRLMVFSLDRETTLPVVQLIEKDYNVSSSPTLIVDGKRLASPTKGELQSALCSAYAGKPGFCGQ